MEDKFDKDFAYVLILEQESNNLLRKSNNEIIRTNNQMKPEELRIGLCK